MSTTPDTLPSDPAMPASGDPARSSALVRAEPVSGKSAGALAPFRVAAFRWLWCAALASNVGTWMHEIGAGWLMKELTSGSKIMVALVQMATTLPLFILSIPAGALADVLDRRRLILACQIGALLLAGVLAFITWKHEVTPIMLILVTIALGTLAALANPAWQTIMTDLVPREHLAHAAGLNGVSINLARAIGPTIGGILVAAQGPEAAFALNAISFSGITLVLWRWDHRPSNRAALAERFFGAIRAGARYVRHHPPMQAVLWRTASFVLAASCLWALMPVIASEHVSIGATGYGLMMGCLGAGAVVGGLILPRARRKLGANTIVVGCSLVFAGTMTTIALVPSESATYPCMFIAGVAWLSIFTIFNGSAQLSAPTWVRARALACYLAVCYAGMAGGSVLWGFVAQRLGIRDALLIASGAEVLGLATLLRYRIVSASSEDVTISRHWDDPVVSRLIDPEDGPVVVTVEYRVDEGDAEEFRAAMGLVAQTRHRDGAFSWTLSRDTENPRRWLEVFFVESWAEHLRQHERVTKGDQKIQERAKAFHRPIAGEPEKPIVGHFIASQPVRARLSRNGAVD